MDEANVITWSANWAWGLPLVALTVVLHAYGLGFLNRKFISRATGLGGPQTFSATSILVMGGAALWATLLHGFEGAVWAASYLLLGALKDTKSAMLYSLNAMTSYGHADLNLAPHWQLMGSLEALNGWILFGLTTAFLFTIMQKAWPRS